MSFESCRFPSIQRVARRGTLWRSGWTTYHKAAELKARACLYHRERFQLLYSAYLSAQPLSELQEVIGLDHPLKEQVFFEFSALVGELWSCLEAVLQEVNCACGLGLSPLARKGRRHVTFGNVRAALAERGEVGILAKLQTLESGQWFSALRKVRNRLIHADIYVRSYEAVVAERALARTSQACDPDSGMMEDVAIGARDIVVPIDDAKWSLSDLAEMFTVRGLEFAVALDGAVTEAVASKGNPQ